MNKLIFITTSFLILVFMPANVSAAQYGQGVLGKKDEPPKVAIVDRKPGLALNTAILSVGLFGTSTVLFFLSKRKENRSSFS